jgi:predicted nucleic acid-binding protein
MVAYLDTSSLVKLYTEEEDSAKVESLVRAAALTSTSIVAYAEARAAFARRSRENAFSAEEHHQIKLHFDRDWDCYFIRNLDQDLIKLAGDLAEKHALRGFDSIHLASAVSLRHNLFPSLQFSSSDRDLEGAARGENLDLA